LQGTPDEIETEEITQHLQQFDNVRDIHDLHIWSMDGNLIILTVHIVLSKKIEMEKLSELKTNIRQSLMAKGIEHATIEFETEDEKCDFEQCC
jgi:cobalt-zinc-cadmium efflux system protein